MRSVIWHFDLLAPLYDRLIGPLLGSHDPERWRKLLCLPTQGWILDAGGGTGRISAPLRSLAKNVVVTDLSRRMLGKARDKGLAGVLGDVEHLPFADGFFDRVVVADALHHVGGQWNALREIVRVLKPGGRLVIEEPDIRRRTVRLAALAEKLAGMKSRFRSADELRDMLVAAGMSAHIEEDGGWTVLIVGDKTDLHP
jgi:demethylmenaquinone methyltransferase/2-methoxy-6-polyprenyl-1,4-benzoquinol methylase